VVGIIFVIFVATVIRAGSGASVPDGEITITSCGATAAGNVRAEVRVENKSKTDKTYFITVEFVEGNQRLGTGLIVVNDLHPGSRPTRTPSPCTSRPAASPAGSAT
jgi:hypothetical protein